MPPIWLQYLATAWIALGVVSAGIICVDLTARPQAMPIMDAVFLTGFTLLGSSLWADYLADFAFAYLFGILFQFFAIAPMRGLGVRDGMIAAIKADTISIAAFEIGMFAWMALTHLALLPHLTPGALTYWFMMQVAMMVGFATSYPANWLLVRAGLKEAM